jgi:hypothetical protein
VVEHGADLSLVDVMSACRCCEMQLPAVRPCICPECLHEFQGSGWDGIDAHWRARHESLMSYEAFWAGLCQAHRQRVPKDMPLPRLKELLRTRRVGACETPACPEYIPKTVGGYGWDSCIRCGWSEPEHLIDALDRALGTAEERIAVLEHALSVAREAILATQVALETKESQ